MPTSADAVSVHLEWLATYKANNSELLRCDPDFARWLETEYVPIVGGWQY